MQQTLTSGSCKPEALSRKAYLLIKISGQQDGIMHPILEMIQRNEKLKPKEAYGFRYTYGVWDAVLELPVAEAENIDEVFKSISQNKKLTQSIENTFTLVGFGAYPSKKHDPTKGKAFTLFHSNTSQDLRTTAEKLYEIKGVIYATPVYGAWDLVVEQEFGNPDECDKVDNDIKKLFGELYHYAHYETTTLLEKK